MKRPHCFGFLPTFQLSKEDLKKIDAQPYICVLAAQDWCKESVVINAFPSDSFLDLSYNQIKETLNKFFCEVEKHAAKAFVREYAKKCQAYYRSNQCSKLLIAAIRHRTSTIQKQKLEKRIEEEKQLAEKQGFLNGVKLARIGGQKYSEELDNELDRAPRHEAQALIQEALAPTENVSTENVSTENAPTENAPTFAITSTASVGIDEASTASSRAVVEDGNEGTERATLVAVDMAGENIQAELPEPLVKEFYEWLYALLLGKEYVAKTNALDRYEWDETSPRDTLSKVSYVLLAQFDPKNTLSLCTLQLSLSYIINCANEEMMDIIRPCFNGTLVSNSLQQADEEPIGEEFAVIEELGDRICESLYDRKEKHPEHRYRNTMKAINKIKDFYLQDSTDCLELQVLDIYEYVLRNIYKFEELNIDDDATEADFFNAIHPIISIVIRCTPNLKSRSGEGACQATKQARALLKTKFDIQSIQRVYGRKIDLLFSDRKHKIELCSAEWKKRNVSVDTLLCQQTKNLRVSKCIFKEIAKLPIPLPELQALAIDIMDWRGFDGCLLKIKRIKGIIYIATLDSTIHIPTHVSQVKSLKDSLVVLFKWKNRLVDLMDTVASAKANSSSSNSFAGVIKARKRSPSPDDYTYFSPKRSR